MMFHPTQDGPLPNGLRVAVATARGRPYYYFSSLLRGMGIRFDSILPERMGAYGGHLVMTTMPEHPGPRALPGPALFFEDISGHPPAVVCGLMIRESGVCTGPEDLVVGIDPGQRSGLAISYCGREIGSSIHSSVEGLVSMVIRVLGGLPARRRLVKIGDGDVETACEIARMLNLRFCSSFEFELVDESRTSPKLKNFNRRGRRDILSARYISRRDGRRRHHDVMPLSMTG